jgi:hypothetical protein
MNYGWTNLLIKYKARLKTVANNGLAQVGLDGRTMSSSNAAVQWHQLDVIY